MGYQHHFKHVLDDENSLKKKSKHLLLNQLKTYFAHTFNELYENN